MITFRPAPLFTPTQSSITVAADAIRTTGDTITLIRYDERGTELPVFWAARKDVLAVAENTEPADSPTTMVVRWVNDEHVEIRLGDQIVAEASHDEEGWDGMRAVIRTCTRIADAFGIEVETEGEPNL